MEAKLKTNVDCAEYFEEDVKENIVDEEKVKHPCNQCEHKASTKRHLKIHIESVHEKIKYSCNLCEYKATTQSSLKSHNQRKHFSPLRSP